jgi:hypothetical protein
MITQWCSVVLQGNEILNVSLDAMESACIMDVNVEKCMQSYRQNMWRTETSPVDGGGGGWGV